MKKILLATAACALFIPLLSAEDNLVQNSGFAEIKDNAPLYWNFSTADGATVEKQEKGSVLHMVNVSPSYKQVSQAIQIEPGTIPCITVKAKIKIKNIVPGAQEWEMARVMVLFFDAKGAQVGDWPELGRWKGTSDLSEKTTVINVPAQAKTIRIQPELSNCTGEMWVTDLSITTGCKIDVPRDADDLLMNGDMEYGSSKPLYWGGWAGDASFDSPGYNSAACYKITNSSPVYSMITQEVPIDSSKIAEITVSGWYKTADVVQGANPWEKARIGIEFHDDKDRIGDWPPVVGEADGTVPVWAYMEHTYKVPKACKKVIVSAGLLNCKGTMWVDKIKLTARTAKGRTYKPEVLKPEDRSDWWVFSPLPDSYTADAIIDLTSSLDAPAGKHGAVTVTAKDGSLAFEDGTPAKFWGTNLVAGDVFRTHAETDLMVRRLAKLGCNLVRLHHMDAAWADPGILDKTVNDTKTFSKESLDRLDYLVSKLKEAGIYIFMDMLVHRKLKAGDGIPDGDKLPAGLKEVVFIDDRLQELTQQYMAALLTHENTYTKIKYKDEPAVVFTEIVNESTVFYWDRDKDIPDSYTRSFNAMFNAFLKEKYGTMDKLKAAWAAYGDSDLAPGEDFDSNTVKRETFDINWEDWRSFAASKCAGRGADTKRFYFAVEKRFFDKMYAYLKSLGIKCLVTGSNHWEKWDADLAANAAYDFVDRHTYWDHPSGGWTMQENLSFTDIPMLKSKQNCVAELAHQRVYGRPFTCSEWNSPLPNEYRSGAPVIMAAYGRLQDWDAMLQFNFSDYEWKNVLTHFVDFSGSPNILSQWLPAVMIWRGDYIKTSKEKIIEYVSEKDMFDSKKGSFKLVNNDFASPLMIYTAKTFDKKQSSSVFSPAMNRGAALSMTQELYWNMKKGVFQVTSDRIQGAAGFLKGGTLKSRNLRITCANKYAAIFLVSLDKKPIAESGKLILNVAARIDNTGAQYGPSHTSVIYGGSGPIIVEPVYGSYVISMNRFKSVKVYSLDANGYISGEYKDVTRAASNQLIIRTGRDSRTFNYYIEITR
jgi:hypothetical protein